MQNKAQETLFKKWMEQYKPLLFKMVRLYAKQSSDEDDLFQEIAVQLWKSAANFKSESSEKTWIYRVALNTALKWSTRSKRRDNEVLTEKMPVLIERHTPDEKLQWLYGQIRKLNEIDRSIMLLLLEGFTYAEMSGLLGISTSNVGVKISRLKERLRQQSTMIKK